MVVLVDVFLVLEEVFLDALLLGFDFLEATVFEVVFLAGVLDSFGDIIRF